MESLKDKVSRGIPLSDEAVIDSHCHMGRWFNFNLHMGEAEGIVARMDRLGVRSCVAAHHSCIGPDYRYGNDEVLEAVAKFPGRIHGYAGVNPNCPAEETITELNRCIEAGMLGIKIHPDMHQHPVNGDGYRSVWEYANEHRLPVLSHTSTGGNNPVNAFADLAQTYPNAIIILGHSGFGSEGADQSIEVAMGHPNVYLETAGSVIIYGTLERMVSRLGADRVLFGTDLPFLDPRPQLGRVGFAKITDDEKRLILGVNAARLFGLAGAV